MIENTYEPSRESPVGVFPFDPSSGSPLLTPKEAAAFLRVAESTLAAWRTGRRGQMGPPFVKLGRRVFYRRIDLEEFVAGNLMVHTGSA
ncbi:helix-turn-helix domain-containing protein [Rhodovulum sp. DZ06]|uniref:helix-turn-helix domain-containing protein n=1 Tax=Rhodovulum sp. DZ06 TaxID=3425126 RepID=UPI003D3460B2